MVLSEFIKTHGWQQISGLRSGRVMSVEVDFINDKHQEDQTELDVGIYNEEELEELFEYFCRENRFPSNTVTDVRIVKIADSFEKLENF